MSISKLISFIFMALSISIAALPRLASENDIQFFSIGFEWPGSACGSVKGCCYQNGLKPSNDFVISSFKPFLFNGTHPEYCNSTSHFSMSKISSIKADLEKNWPSLTCPKKNNRASWSYNWKRYGACSQSVSQYHYFKAALSLRKIAKLLSVLQKAGIRPDGEFYSTATISDTILHATQLPALQCHRDKAGNYQLYQIHLCADGSGTKIVDCPGVPGGNPFRHCPQKVKFPSFK